MTGCGAPVDALDLGRARDPVLSGTATTDEFNVGLRQPWATADFACSGTLVRNDIVLTAGHCFQNGQPDADSCFLSGTGCPEPDAEPSEIRVTQHMATDTHIWGVAGTYSDSPVVDAAVFRLQSPFTVNGSTLGHSVPLWGGAEDDLNQHPTLGEEHQQRGFGRNGGTNCANLDTQREQLTHADPGGDATYLHYLRENNRIILPGDSGSSFRWTHARYATAVDRPILGITTWGTQNPVDPPGGVDPECLDHSYATKVTKFRSWAHGRLEALGSPATEHYDYDPLVNYEITPGTTWTVSGGYLVRAANAFSRAVDRRIAGSNSSVGTRVFSTDTGGRIGLLARWRDPCNFYEFRIDTTLGRVKLLRTVACAETTLKDVALSVNLNNGGQGSFLTFTLLGKRLTGYVGLNPVATADDNTPAVGWLTAGRFGFYAANMGNPSVQFDYLKVAPLTGAEP